VSCRCGSCKSCKAATSHQARRSTPKTFPDEKECPECLATKAAAEFRKASHRPDGLDRKCKTCMSEYARAKGFTAKREASGRGREARARYRDRNKGAIREKFRKRRESGVDRGRANDRRSGIRTKALEALGGACVRCGLTDVDVLCVDHVDDDGAREREEVGRNPFPTFVRICRGEDLPRYQVLCCNCNREKQAFRTREENDSPGDLRTKECSQCLLRKPWGSFVKDKTKSSGRKSECKACCRFRGMIRKVKVLERIGESCTGCGEGSPVRLEVDHVKGDGAALRSSGEDRQLYLKILSGRRVPEGLQTLCANCNARKERKAVCA